VLADPTVAQVFLRSTKKRLAHSQPPFRYPARTSPAPSLKPPPSNSTAKAALHRPITTPAWLPHKECRSMPSSRNMAFIFATDSQIWSTTVKLPRPCACRQLHDRHSRHQPGESPPHLWAALRYTELNPSGPDEYRWSSAAAHCWRPPCGYLAGHRALANCLGARRLVRVPGNCGSRRRRGCHSSEHAHGPSPRSSGFCGSVGEDAPAPLDAGEGRASAETTGPRGTTAIRLRPGLASRRNPIFGLTQCPWRNWQWRFR
jgi:hypothetical protein